MWFSLLLNTINCLLVSVQKYLFALPPILFQLEIFFIFMLLHFSDLTYCHVIAQHLQTEWHSVPENTEES